MRQNGKDDFLDKLNMQDLLFKLNDICKYLELKSGVEMCLVEQGQAGLVQTVIIMNTVKQ